VFSAFAFAFAFRVIGFTRPKDEGSCRLAPKGSYHWSLGFYQASVEDKVLL
jgi:hypothetical protein